MPNDPDEPPAWQPARLIPTSGIKGANEQERRATSALLAVLGSVDEFGRTITSLCGAPAGKIETFIEVPFELDDNTVIPDGLIRVKRGKREWTCLVEVKTAANELDAMQLGAYLDVAKANQYDALLTISNEIPTVAGNHPTDVDKRKTRKVDLFHLSWTRILSEAILERSHRGVDDVDQAWILSELIRYLESPKSGAMPRIDMGTNWVKIRDAAKRGTLRASDDGVQDVAQRWDQLVRYVSLVLSRELGTEVEVRLSKKESADTKYRTELLVDDLVSNGRCSGTLKIPDVAGPIDIFANLRTLTVGASMSVDAPKEGRARTRVNWLLRQLKTAPADLIVESRASRSRHSMSEPLVAARSNPDSLVEDKNREPVEFTLTLIEDMGRKRGEGSGGFPTSVMDALRDFYGTTAQNLKPWTPSAPKIHRTKETEEAAAGPDET